MTTGSFCTSISPKLTSRANKSAITGPSSASVVTSEALITSEHHSHEPQLLVTGAGGGREEEEAGHSAVCHTDSLVNSEGNCSTFC